MPGKVLRIVNQDDVREEVQGPLDLLVIANSDRVTLVLEEYVNRIELGNSDNVHITAKKGWGSKTEINCDDVTVTHDGDLQQSVPSRQTAQSEQVGQDVISQIGDPDLADATISYRAKKTAQGGNIKEAVAIANQIKDQDLRDATLAYIAIKS